MMPELYGPTTTQGIIGLLRVRVAIFLLVALAHIAVLFNLKVAIPTNHAPRAALSAVEVSLMAAPPPAIAENVVPSAKPPPQRPVVKKPVKTATKPISRPTPVATPTPKRIVAPVKPKPPAAEPQRLASAAAAATRFPDHTAATQQSAPPTIESPVVKLLPPRHDAAYLHNPSPTYPLLSKRRGEEGEVLLHVDVAPSGEPTRVAVARSSSFSRLDQVALDTVRRWRFVPARRGDVAVAGSVLVPVGFYLR